MHPMIFVNLPVTDLDRSIAFYTAIGFSKNDQFSDETAACMVLSDTIHVMVLTHAKWQTFTTRSLPDPKNSAQVMLCLTSPSKTAVDDFIKIGSAAGGIADPNPPQDYGFMYGRSVEDPDGHIWETVWMDTSAIPS